ncbi:MAG: TolC family protein [Nitrospinales bacterium]
MCRKHILCVMVAAHLISGCASYAPKPLTASGVGQALAAPSLERARVEARLIRHPILKPIAFDDRDGLSPDEAAVLAVLANPKLKAIRDQRLIAGAQLLQAGLLPNPQFSINPAFPVSGNTQGVLTALGFGLNVNVVKLLTRKPRMEAAERQAVAVDLNVSWREWQTAQAAKSATYQLSILNAQVVLAAELDKVLAETVGLMRDAEMQGLITRLERSAAESASNKAHATVLNLKKQANQQRLMLNRLLGAPTQTQVVLQKDIDAPATFEAPSMDRLLDGLEERRLDLVALRHGYKSQEAAVRAAILRQFPQIQVGPTGTRDAGGFYSAGINISMSLPIFNRNQGRIALKKATRKKLYDEYINRVFLARSDIGKLLSNIHWLNKQIQTAQAAQPILQRLTGSLRSALNENQANIVSYYTALTNLTAKRIQTLKLKQQLMNAIIALEVASGLYKITAIESETRETPFTYSKESASNS